MEEKKRSITKSDILIWIVMILLFTAFFFIFKPTVVVGESMEPTLENGNYLLINRMSYKNDAPEPGDVVVCHSDLDGGELIIKRVIGVSGDEISIDEDGKVYVNDKKIDEPYISNDDVAPIFGEWTVPEGSVFLLGDHRSASLDSRFEDVGYIQYSDIVGKVQVRLFPFGEWRTF